MRPSPADWGRRVETAVKEQAVEVRRFIVASLDSFAGRTSRQRLARLGAARAAAWAVAAAGPAGGAGMAARRRHHRRVPRGGGIRRLPGWWRVTKRPSSRPTSRPSNPANAELQRTRGRPRGQRPGSDGGAHAAAPATSLGRLLPPTRRRMHVWKRSPMARFRSTKDAWTLLRELLAESSKRQSFPRRGQDHEPRGEFLPDRQWCGRIHSPPVRHCRSANAM